MSDMKMQIVGLMVLMVNLLFIPEDGFAASYDCTKAGSLVEKLICANSDLSKLDEALSTKYKAKLQAAKNVGALKSSQKEWLKARNQCTDSDCLQRAYQNRLTVLESSPPAAYPHYGFAPEVAQALYGTRRGLGPVDGKGYSACEAYLKYLNSLPKEPVCEIPTPPGFSPPDWQELNVLDHLDWAYWIEQHFRMPSPNKLPEFETWRKNFLAEMQEGKIAPRLRKTRLMQPPLGRFAQAFAQDTASGNAVPFEVIGYTRDRDACPKVGSDQARSQDSRGWGGQLGDVLVRLPGESSEQPLQAFGKASQSLQEILIYDGKPYFVRIDQLRKVAEFRFYAFSVVDEYDLRAICDLSAYHRN